MDRCTRLCLFYSWGYVTKAQVKRFVELNALTEEEYKKVTGEDYNLIDEPDLPDEGEPENEEE